MAVPDKAVYEEIRQLLERLPIGERLRLLDEIEEPPANLSNMDDPEEEARVFSSVRESARQHRKRMQEAGRDIDADQATVWIRESRLSR